MEVDYYYLLGVAENASHKEIRQAYRRMAEIYHPDKLSQLPAASRKEGEEIMRLLNDAKTILLDPVQRQYYDIRVGVIGGPRAEEAIILEEEAIERVEAIEIEPVRRKMNRVISSMRDVFSGDEEFTEKLEVAQEIIEARVMEARSSKVTVEDEDDELDDRGIEMRLEFTVVDEGEKQSGPPPPEGNAKKKGFKVLAMEGDEEDAVEVDWEEA